MRLTTKIRLRIVGKTLLTLSVAALFCGIYLYYSSTLKNASNGIYAIPAFAVAYIIFLFKSGFVKMLRDRDWVGEIISVKTVIDSEPITFSVAISRRLARMIPYTIVEARKENGECVKLKIQSRKMNPSVFRIGGRIKHYRTTIYPMLLEHSDPNLHFCPLCGRDLNNPYCPDCKVKL